MRAVSHKHEWTCSECSLIQINAHANSRARARALCFLRRPHRRLNHGFAQPEAVILAHFRSDDVLAHARAYIRYAQRLLAEY